MKQVERLNSQLEKLRSIYTSSSNSLAYVDVDKHLRIQIGQLAKVAVFLRDMAIKRISALSPKASLLRNRLEYLETRRAIGMVSEDIYLEARRELIGRAGEVEDSMVQLIKLVDQFERVMLKSETLLKAPAETRQSSGHVEKRDSTSTISITSTDGLD